MRHLPYEALVDALDHALPAEQSRHLEACDRCRSDLAALRRSVDEVRALEAPEPSPLYWQQFSRRVHDVVEGEPDPVRWRVHWPERLRHPLTAAFASAAVVLLAISAGLWRGSLVKPTARPAPPIVAPIASTSVDLVDALDDPNGDATWNFVLTAAETVDWTDEPEADLGVRPGSAERAVLQLSPEERSELARLIEVELKRREG